MAVPETATTLAHSIEAADVVFAHITKSPATKAVPDVIVITVVPAFGAAVPADMALEQAVDAARTEAIDLQVSLPAAFSETSTRYSVPLVPKAAVEPLPWSIKKVARLTPARDMVLESTVVDAAIRVEANISDWIVSVFSISTR